MKVLVVDGYLRENGNTARLSQAFLAKMNEESIEAGVVPLRKLTIGNCLNCGACESKSECAIKDDMTQLYGDILAADVIIATSPVYMWNMTGALKTFYDRLHCYSTMYAGKKMAVIVSAGGGLLDGADIIEDSLKRFCEHCGISWAGMLFEQCEGEEQLCEKDRALMAANFYDSVFQ